jgi:hypothetical protein
MAALGLEASILSSAREAERVRRRRAKAGDLKKYEDIHNVCSGAEPVIDHGRFAAILADAKPTDRQVDELARRPGVAAPSLARLGVAYDREFSRWVVPLSDHLGRAVGLTYVYPAGGWTSAPGSWSGLLIPSGLDVRGPLFLTIGAAGTAAVLSVGAAALGRPDSVATALQVRWARAAICEQSGRTSVVVLRNRGSDRYEKSTKRCVEILGIRLMFHCPPVVCAAPADGFSTIEEQVRAGAWSCGVVVERDLHVEATQGRSRAPDVNEWIH